jgi:hypothetical protein
LHFFETSAKDGTNLEESIMFLVDYILKNNVESEGANDNRGVDIAAGGGGKKEGGSCC